MTDTDSFTRVSPSITADGARAVLDRAVGRAIEMGLAFCVCVADPSGEPVATLRMDGAPRLAAQIAANKAYTVAGFNGVPTHAFWDNIKDDPSLVHSITHTPRLVAFGGGVPLRAGGEVVGAIGVSGGTTGQDREVAEAGAAVLDSVQAAGASR
jgi:uncharacterized protein GlcG (DUF336 family)